jgi:hypothetical protein
LHAACPALPVRGLGDAVEQKVARGIPRREVDAAVTGEPGDLKIDVVVLLWTILQFVAIELVVGNVVEPWLFGARTGLSSVALIAAATF